MPEIGYYGRNTEEKGFFARCRFVYDAHCYGAIYVYASLWTLLKHFLVFITALLQTDVSRDELLEQVDSTFRQKFEIEDDEQIVIGETARSLFYAFLLSLELAEDDIIITTPLQHYSFIRIYKALNINVITVDMKLDGSGWDWETFFKLVTPDQIRRCRACVVTHMYGFNQKYDEMAKWCHENEVLIFEDCIQGYTLYQNTGLKMAHMSVYSGGMDKIPCTTKGGFGIVRHNPQIATRITNVIENFPEQPWSKRLNDLASQWGYWFLTATKLGSFIVIFVGTFYGGLRNMADISQFVRTKFLKAYTGKFTVDRVSFRPSAFHLQSIVLGVQRTDRQYVDMLHDSRSAFRDILGEKYANLLMPWKNGGDWLDDHANLYWHCLVRQHDVFLAAMSEGGWGAMFQQAWDCSYQMSGFPEPVYARFLRENMTYLPLMHQMLRSEMEEVAVICKAHLDKYHADGLPARPKELMQI